MSVIRKDAIAVAQIGGLREPTGRLQLRVRVLFGKESFDRDRRLQATLETFDSSTQRNSFGH